MSFLCLSLAASSLCRWVIRPTAKKQLIKQQVVLSGLASAQFSADIDVLHKMHVWLDRYFPSGTLAQWNPLVVGGHTSLEFGNRLFTPLHFVESTECLPLSRDIDPSGALQRAMGKDLGHTEDNIVRYFHLSRTRPYVFPVALNVAHAFRTDVPPTLFRPGDIVQVSFTVNVFESKSSARLGLVLRSITLLDSRFAMVSALARVPLSRLRFDSKLHLRRRLPCPLLLYRSSHQRYPLAPSSDRAITGLRKMTVSIIFGKGSTILR